MPEDPRSDGGVVRRRWVSTTSLVLAAVAFVLTGAVVVFVLPALAGGPASTACHTIAPADAPHDEQSCATPPPAPPWAGATLAGGIAAALTAATGAAVGAIRRDRLTTDQHHR